MENEPFHIRSTVDVDSTGYYNTEEIERTIREPIETNHRIGQLTVFPDQFYFREFGGNYSSEKCQNTTNEEAVFF